jgi:hypothetical protein
MISVCVAFYPWHRQFERSEQLLDVLIKSMNMADNKYEMELCVGDAGVVDTFMAGRVHDPGQLFGKAGSLWKGSLQWIVDKEFIQPDRTGKENWSMSHCIQSAADISNGDYLFLTGIDITIPKNFVELYHSIVDDRRCWVPKCYKLLDGMEWRKYSRPEYARFVGWYGAKGIVGITKKNFYDMGGYPTQYRKARSDSEFFRIMNTRFDVYHENCDDMYHIGHYGSQGSKYGIWTLDQLEDWLEKQKVEEEVVFDKCLYLRY